MKVIKGRKVRGGIINYKIIILNILICFESNIFFVIKIMIILIKIMIWKYDLFGILINSYLIFKFLFSASY